MEEFVLVGLMLAGVLAMIALPVAVVALSREVSRNRRLEERNAAQAGTIVGLQHRLSLVLAADERAARFEEECG